MRRRPDIYMHVSHWDESAHVKHVMKQVLAFRKEMESECPEWVAERRGEYLTGLLNQAGRNLISWRLLCCRLALRMKSGKSGKSGKKESIRRWLFRFADMSPFPRQIAEIKKQIEWLVNRNEIKFDRATQAMIDKAKSYPIENLLAPEIVRAGKMLCPWHNDKNPSMMIRKGHGYAHCFVCNKTMDAIDYMRVMKNLSFHDAVKALQ